MPLPTAASLLNNEENTALRMIRDLRKRASQVERRTSARTNFANASSVNVIVGEGNPFNIEDPFTGTAILYPAFEHTSGNFHIIGMNAGVLQFGLSADDGKIYAGGGDVVIDENGINFANQQGDLTFEDTSGNINTLVIYSDGLDELVLKNAVGGKAVRFDIDDASHNVASMSFTYDGIFLSNDNDANEFTISNVAGTPTFFNGGGADIDWYVETDSNPFALYIDAGLDKAISFAWDGWQSMGYQTWTRTGNHVFTVSQGNEGPIQGRR
jgi:hypothetical protein